MKIVKAKLKERFIGFRVNEDVFMQLFKLASKRGLSISELIREIVKIRIEKEVK